MNVREAMSVASRLLEAEPQTDEHRAIFVLAEEVLSSIRDRVKMQLDMADLQDELLLCRHDNLALRRHKYDRKVDDENAATACPTPPPCTTGMAAVLLKAKAKNDMINSDSLSRGYSCFVCHSKDHVTDACPFRNVRIEGVSP